MMMMMMMMMMMAVMMQGDWPGALPVAACSQLAMVPQVGDQGRSALTKKPERGLFPLLLMHVSEARTGMLLPNSALPCPTTRPCAMLGLRTVSLNHLCWAQATSRRGVPRKIATWQMSPMRHALFDFVFFFVFFPNRKNDLNMFKNLRFSESMADRQDHPLISGFRVPPATTSCNTIKG
ncbi:hypothetical protein F5Y17DRAFT_410187, partial [Xylariaceae sp. FL0594]